MRSNMSEPVMSRSTNENETLMRMRIKMNMRMRLSPYWSAALERILDE